MITSDELTSYAGWHISELLATIFQPVAISGCNSLNMIMIFLPLFLTERAYAIILSGGGSRGVMGGR